MNIPKRHHFVPELLQKRFQSESGGLWTFDSRSPHRGVWCGTTENLLLEGHLYSHVHADGTKDATLEMEFSELEGLAAPIVEKIVSSARSDRLPNLSPSERSAWDIFFYQQWRRVPDLFASLMNAEQHRFEVEHLINEFSRTVRPLSSSERDQLLDPVTLKRMHRNLRVASLRTGSESALDVLARRGIAVIRINNPRKSFILGSRPVAKLTLPDVTELSDPRVELWLPIAADVMVGVGTVDRREIKASIADHQIRNMNMAFAQQSSQIVGRSRALIASIAPFVGSNKGAAN